mmetsp:Transcript_125776/g.363867  ORF Transcript_125776/g.363867 Transcript_125776/m.363867 type:complete len:241 (-) Transcript_125776:182-904(-)
MVVAGMGDATTDDLVVLLQAVGQASDGCDEKLPRLVRLPRVEPIDASVGADRPVVVLSGAVDAGEGFLVHQCVEAHLLRFFLQNLHEEHIVVAREGRVAVDRGHLVLAASDLVVQHRHRDAELKHHFLDVEHQSLHLRRWWCEVVELALLIAAGQLADQRAPAVDQIRALLVQVRLDDKKLLLPTEVGVNGLDAPAPTDVLQEAESFPADGVVRPEERNLVIDRGAEVGDEGARHAQDAV